MIDNNGLIFFNLREKSKFDKKKQNAIKVGIPQYLICAKSGRLWKYFFEKLGLCVIVPESSSKESIMEGKSLLHDDTDLASAVLCAQISKLSKECDFILLSDCCLRDFYKILSIFEKKKTKILLIKNDDLPLVDPEETRFISNITGKSEAQVISALTFASRDVYDEKKLEKCILLSGNPVIISDLFFNLKISSAIDSAGFNVTFEEDIDTIAAINFVNIKLKDGEKSFSFLPQTDVFFDSKGVFDESIKTLNTFLSSLSEIKL